MDKSSEVLIELIISCLPSFYIDPLLNQLVLKDERLQAQGTRYSRLSPCLVRSHLQLFFEPGNLLLALAAVDLCPR